MSSSIMLLKSNRRFQVSLDIALLWWSWKTKHTWYTLWNKQNMLWWVETRCILMLVIMYNEIQSCSWGNSLMFPERSASSSGFIFCCHVLSKYTSMLLVFNSFWFQKNVLTGQILFQLAWFEYRLNCNTLIVIVLPWSLERWYQLKHLKKKPEEKYAWTGFKPCPWSCEGWSIL